MHIDAFLVRLKANIEAFEIHMKVKYPLLCSGDVEGCEQDTSDWYEQFQSYMLDKM